MMSPSSNKRISDLLKAQIEGAKDSFSSPAKDAEILPSVASSEKSNLPGSKEEKTEDRVQSIKKTRTPAPKSSRTQENKKSRIPENKNSKDPEFKKSRVVTDSSGKTRRPANITIADDVKVAMDVLAAQRRVRVWTLYDQACRELLAKEGK